MLYLIYALLSLGLARDNRPVKLLTLGDSITEGYSPHGSPGGYRTALYTDLKAAGRRVQMLGTQTDNPSSVLTAARETHHEGHPGYLITGMKVQGAFHAGLGENAAKWLAGMPAPDVIFLMAGSNDLALNADAANAPGRLGELLDQLAGLAPGARIVVSTVLYSRIAGVNPGISKFNDALTEIVKGKRKVTLVDLSRVLTVPDDYDDDYHPNKAGYEKLGHAIARVLK